MQPYTRRLPPELGRDGNRVFFVDESGDPNPREQGDFYVFAGILTDDVRSLSGRMHSFLQTNYPERKELKSYNINPHFRATCLDCLAELSIEVIPHVIYKPRVTSPTLLSDSSQFYRASYNNLLKLIPDTNIHIVTDAYFSELKFRHFENSIKLVQDKNILSITPVKSETCFPIQAADIVAGSLRNYLMEKRRHCTQYPRLQSKLILNDDIVFPRGCRQVLRRVKCQE